MHTEPQVHAVELERIGEARARQGVAAVCLVAVAVFGMYWSTAAAMVSTWLASETYKHCFLVIPAFAWFVWKERARLGVCEVRPWWPALVGLAGAGMLWLVGDLASALAPSQWAMVAMVPLSVAALFGIRFARALAFPLVFLFFAVPFGEGITPTLIDWTADFTVWALQATGIPVFREGQHFVIPSGRWSVVTACSGVRYLTASMMVGVLYAWTIYRSPVRRALFIVASIAVPIIANWVRAYLIVMIGHFSNNQLAVGVDHFIYGWLFFGLIIGAMFWIGTWWREDHELAVANRPSSDRANVQGSVVRPPLSALLAVAVLILAWPVAGAALLSRVDAQPIEAAGIEPMNGWSTVATPAAAWQPALEGPARIAVQSFARDGATVTAFFGFFRSQRQGTELVNAMHRLVPDASWQQLQHGSLDARLNSESVRVRTATMRGHGERFRLWHAYWLDDRFETSDTRAKLSLALDRLLMRDDTSAWVAISVAAETDAEGDRILGRFAQDMGRPIASALARTAAR